MTISVHKTDLSNRTQTLRFYPFVSTGKERDEETGYGYFGARYMDHELMTMWLSVDPLADKYPSLSPYAYCAWNPVKLVDPDGRIIDTISLNQEIKDMINPNHETYNEHFHTLYDKLNEDDRAVYSFIKLNSPKKRYDGVEMYGELRCAGRDEQDRDRIIIDYCSSPRYRDRYLLEETYHACQYRYGQIGFEFIGGLWKGICNDLWDEANAQLFAIKHTKQNLTYRSADDVNLLNAFNEDGFVAAISVLKKSGIYGGYADYSICVEDYIRSTSNVGDKNLYRGNSSNIETIIFRKP